MVKKIAFAGLLSAAVLAAVSCTQTSQGLASKSPADGSKPTTSEPKAPAISTRPPTPITITPVAQNPGSSAAPDPKTLKGAYNGMFLIGTAADPGNYSDAEQSNMKAQYNIITPENCMKPQPIHPSENTYAFAAPDALVKWAEDNNIKIHGHTLAWHSQTAQWFFQAGADGVQPTRELGMARLKSHIETVVGHFKGHITSWDVVNEAINDGAGGLNGAENLRRSPWVSLIGPDYISMAFKWAHAADPQAHLYYNDYSIENGATQGTGKNAASMALLKRLIADGAPIYGVGIQGHMSLNENIADFEKAISNYESLGLKISISELDITVTGNNSGALNGGGGGGAAGADGFTRQAQVYARVFDVLKRHAKSIERVTLWGINDQRSWRRGQNPLLFDAQMNPKPAFQAVLDVALGKAPQL